MRLHRPLLATLATLAASASAQPQDTLPRSFAFELAPGKVHEECLRIGKGDGRRYEWKSTGKVDFNVHYHVDKEVFYPVKREDVSKSKGRFKAKTAQEYCWMWTAKAPAKIDGRIWR